MDLSSVLVAFSTSRTSKTLNRYQASIPNHFLPRFGLGLILQAKVKLSHPSEQVNLVENPPRQRSLMRRISTRLFSRRSITGRSNSKHRKKGTLHQMSEEQTCTFDNISEEPLSPVQSPKSSVPLRRRLSKQFSRLFSQSDLPNPDTETKPQYNTAPLHLFISESFPGSTKLEEHQVNDYQARLNVLP